MASLFCSMMTRRLPGWRGPEGDSAASNDDVAGSDDLSISGRLDREPLEDSCCTVRCKSLKLTTFDNNLRKELLSWGDAPSMECSLAGEPFSGIGFRKSNILADRDARVRPQSLTTLCTGSACLWVMYSDNAAEFGAPVRVLEYSGSENDPISPCWSLFEFGGVLRFMYCRPCLCGCIQAVADQFPPNDGGYCGQPKVRCSQRGCYLHFRLCVAYSTRCVLHRQPTACEFSGTGSAGIAPHGLEWTHEHKVVHKDKERIFISMQAGYRNQCAALRRR